MEGKPRALVLVAARVLLAVVYPERPADGSSALMIRVQPQQGEQSMHDCPEYTQGLAKQYCAVFFVKTLS